MSDIIGDKENSSPERISALSQEAAMGSASPLVEEIRASNNKTVTMLSREEIDNMAKNTVFSAIVNNKAITTACPTSIQKKAMVKSSIATPGRPLSAATKINITTPLSVNVSLKLETPTSLSKTREAAKNAKLQNTTEKIQKTKELKEKWAKQKEENLKRNGDKKAEDLKRLQEANEAAALLRKQQLEVKKMLDDKKKAEEKDLLTSSLEERKHVSDNLERMKKEKKRQSVLLNNEILKKAQEIDAAMKAAKKAEEDALLAKRRVDCLQTRQEKKEEEIRRRESLVSRGEEYKKQKEIAVEMQRKREEEDRSILQFRHTLSKNLREEKEQSIRQDRQSITERLSEWRDQRKKEEEQDSVDKEYQTYILEMRRLDWCDVENYKKKQDQMRRESVAFRLDEWRQHKTLDAQNEAEENEAKEYEALLKQQEREDIIEYQEMMKSQRKQSLLFRMEKHKQEKVVEKSLEQAKYDLEEEERLKRETDRNDVAQYMQSMLLARRQSLEYRNQVALQDRLRVEGEKQMQKESAAKDRELIRLAYQDVQEHQAKEREDRRRSLALRIVEDRKQKEVDISHHREALNIMHNELETKRLCWLDDKDAKVMEKERSRKSIAFRMDSWKQQRLAEEMLQAKKDLIEEEEELMRKQDWEDMQKAKEAAKLEERMDLIKGNFVL